MKVNETKDIRKYNDIKKQINPDLFSGGVFDDVLRLSYLLMTFNPSHVTKLVDLKKNMSLLESKGEKYSPFVKRFVLLNLPLCVKSYLGNDESAQLEILRLMMKKALQNKTMLHLDFVSYKKNLLRNEFLPEQKFFLIACAVAEKLVISDSKETLCQSIDDRIKEFEQNTLTEVPEKVKSAVKKALFSFKRERIHLSHKAKEGLNENYVLLKKMCNKVFFEKKSQNRKHFKNTRTDKQNNERVK